jgi:hypothetical protein
MVEVVTAADVREYDQTMATIDRVIDKRINKMPVRTGKREVTEEQWRHELGQDRSGYQQAQLAYTAERDKLWHTPPISNSLELRQ